MATALSHSKREHMAEETVEKVSVLNIYSQNTLYC